MKNLKEGRFILIPLLFALLFGACSRGPNDQQIISSIQAKLYQNPDLKTLSVNVTSNHGVVTLSGAVNAPLEKLALEGLAKNTDGVKQVIDQLTVDASPSAQQANPADSSPPAPAAGAESAPRPRAAHHKRHAAHPVESAEASAPSEPAGPAESADASPPAAPQPAPAPPPPQPVELTIPSGTAVRVRMVDPISSETAQAGQVFNATVFSPVAVGSRVVIPQGADAKVRVVEVKSAGHYRGQSELKLALVNISINGEDRQVESGYYDKLGSSRGKNTAEKVGGGAGLGALIGGLIGHGKGAGIGAGIGAAAGGVTQAATHGQQVTIPSEAKLDFVLKAPVTVTVQPGD